MSNKENIREIILIGRDRDCNFICDDSSVSRHHAQIIDYGTSYSVVDVGSTNGTFVNGNRVSSETTLHSGDELRTGNIVVPWQQLVQPPQEPKSNKKLLWVLIPIIVALLIGGGLAIYFIYGRAKDKDEEAKDEKKEVVEVLKQRITENKEQAEKLEEEKRSAEMARKETRQAQEEERKAKERRDKAIMEADKAREDLDKAKKEAGKAKAEADKAREDLDKAKKEAGKAKEEAGKAKEEAGKAKEEADKAKEEADKAKEEADEAKMVYEGIEGLLEPLNDEQLKTICKELNIKVHDLIPPRQQLIKAFYNGDTPDKQRIIYAIKKEKQRISTNKSKD